MDLMQKCSASTVQQRVGIGCKYRTAKNRYRIRILHGNALQGQQRALPDRLNRVDCFLISSTLAWQPFCFSRPFARHTQGVIRPLYTKKLRKTSLCIPSTTRSVVQSVELKGSLTSWFPLQRRGWWHRDDQLAEECECSGFNL